ncbi:lipid-A-disaccharide synthase [Mizugakiibacter sediminis]|uniref:Lipid-A-disaccharide synthase n=2 Tax=Mizugakiibacter sediminis TaxID=1475481 RepID=A0A0K8QP78_9GAMM|nr:lipid-A-disaccharide synthase [Mizugakiibacter sediminis]GAP66531.1 lipid-A-disaccharide synthase [Mizugakiibacter sediminis]
MPPQFTRARPQPAPEPRPPVFALIAGEASGDLLGADLVAALRRRHPQARFVGIGGPRMAAQGFEAWHDIAALSVMGLAEVLRHLPRLLRLRRTLAARLLALRPDVTIGIDAPDFNLGLERRLKQAGLRTVHYVSPSVWAWRERRAAKIGASADRVLCLFPMEPEIYARHGVDARFVGHPLADRFPLHPDRAAARAALGLPADAPVLAVLPGSRPGEIARLAGIFLDAARRVAAAVPGLRVVIPAADAACRTAIEQRIAASPPSPVSRLSSPVLLDGRAHETLVAADAVLLASGTAALEAMLAKRPMVAAYRIAPASYRLVRALRLLKTDVYTLPNILAGRRVVPELMQDACTPAALADALLGLLRDPVAATAQIAEFECLHGLLKAGAADGAAGAAAEAVDELLRPAAA